MKNEDKIISIIDDELNAFNKKFSKKHLSKSKDCINLKSPLKKKKFNPFYNGLSSEFTVYSGLARSYDSSIGNVLQNISNRLIKEVGFGTNLVIDNPFLYSDQVEYIDKLMHKYENGKKPTVADYTSFASNKQKKEKQVKSFTVDMIMKDDKSTTYSLFEIKSGAQLDVKKAPEEKKELLKNYFIVKNYLDINNKNYKVRIYLGVTYNKNGFDDEAWNQKSVENYFSDDEIMVGRKYWNYILDDEEAFNTIIKTFEKKIKSLNKTINKIKNIYIKECK